MTVWFTGNDFPIFIVETRNASPGDKGVIIIATGSYLTRTWVVLGVPGSYSERRRVMTWQLDAALYDATAPVTRRLPRRHVTVAGGVITSVSSPVQLRDVSSAGCTGESMVAMTRALNTLRLQPEALAAARLNGDAAQRRVFEAWRRNVRYLNGADGWATEADTAAGFTIS